MSPRYLIFLLAIVANLFVNCVHADDQETEKQKELRERDFEALREFLRTKRDIDIEKKRKNLSISGDVRFEWQHITETGCHDRRLRGPGAFVRSLPVSRNDFDVEFNLKFDYEYKRAWAAAQLQFDNGAGTGELDQACATNPKGCLGSGDKNRLNLKRAYLGYNIWECGDSRLDIEIGRRKFYELFDSVIQFDSRFDGIALEWTANKLAYGDFYWYLGGLIVDERVNHFAWVTEAGLQDILKTGFYVKYSFIDWVKRGRNRCKIKRPRGWQFRNSQVTIGRFTELCLFSKKQIVEFYGAAMINHAASDLHVPFRHCCIHGFDKQDHSECCQDKHGHDKRGHDKRGKNFGKQNIGWYVGILIGKPRKEGDWSFEAIYEYVEAQSVSECDSAGIGRGNINNDFLTQPIRRGNTNFKGVSFEHLYMITDNLMIDTQFKYSTALNAKIGGSHRYSNLEVEVIYAF